MKILASVLLPFLLASSTLVHDFHLSKTDVHYKTEQEALQLTVHTFIDDTEAGLKELENLDYKFFESTEHELTDSIFSVYLKENISIVIDGVEQEFVYLGKEASDDIQGVYSYLEVEGLSSFENITIRNSILMDQFDDQKNIINFKVDNKSKAFHILTKGDNQKEISI